MAAFWVIFFLGLYFIPTITALIRKVPNTGSVIVINVLLGWSLVGWAVAMAMASRSQPQAATVIVHNTVGQAPYYTQGPAALPPTSIPMPQPIAGAQYPQPMAHPSADAPTWYTS